MTSAHADVSRDAWKRFLDLLQFEWQPDRDALADDGVEAPSLQTIEIAYQLAKSFMDSGKPAPDKLVRDPNGGIVFSRRVGSWSEVLHVWDDGEAEVQVFDGATLIRRHPLLQHSPE